MGKIEYREATLGDVRSLVLLSMDMWSESPQYNHLMFNGSHLAERFIRRIVASESVVFVVEVDDRVIGFIAGHVSEFFFTDERLAVEDGWYVAPEYRRGMTGPKLLRTFEQWAAKVGAKEVKVAPSAGIGGDRIYSLLDRLGYSEAGRIFKKTVVKTG